MIEIQMSKDVRDLTPKILGPFTARQLVCVLIALAYGVPLFFLLFFIGDVVVRIIISIVFMAPTIACGWCELYGMHLEQFFLHMLRTTFTRPKQRKYISPNAYEEEQEKIEFEFPETQERQEISFFKTIKYSKNEKPIR